MLPSNHWPITAPDKVPDAKHCMTSTLCSEEARMDILSDIAMSYLSSTPEHIIGNPTSMSQRSYSSKELTLPDMSTSLLALLNMQSTESLQPQTYHRSPEEKVQVPVNTVAPTTANDVIELLADDVFYLEDTYSRTHGNISAMFSSKTEATSTPEQNPDASSSYDVCPPNHGVPLILPSHGYTSNGSENNKNQQNSTQINNHDGAGMTSVLPPLLDVPSGMPSQQRNSPQSIGSTSNNLNDVIIPTTVADMSSSSRTETPPLHSPSSTKENLPQSDEDSTIEGSEGEPSPCSAPSSPEVASSCRTSRRRTSGRISRQRSKRCAQRQPLVWQFILDTLANSQYNPDYITWLDRDQGIFKFTKSKGVAQLWGERRQNADMNYEFFSRAMRYHYKACTLKRVPGKRLVYQFASDTCGWREYAGMSS